MIKEYTVNDYLEDKIKKEDEIKELQEYIEKLQNELNEKIEKYHMFVDNFLKSHRLSSNIYEED